MQAVNKKSDLLGNRSCALIVSCGTLIATAAAAIVLVHGSLTSLLLKRPLFNHRTALGPPPLAGTSYLLFLLIINLFLLLIIIILLVLPSPYNRLPGRGLDDRVRVSVRVRVIGSPVSPWSQLRHGKGGGGGP